MPTRRKFTARFPTTRIKKIMQLDEEIGKLAATVPPVVSRALELFMEELVSQAYDLTATRNSRTISPSCIKHVIDSNPTFDFLRNLVMDVPELKPSQIKSVPSSGCKPRDFQSEMFDSGSELSSEELDAFPVHIDHKPPSKRKAPNRRRKRDAPDSEDAPVDYCVSKVSRKARNANNGSPKRRNKRKKPDSNACSEDRVQSLDSQVLYTVCQKQGSKVDQALLRPIWVIVLSWTPDARTTESACCRCIPITDCSFAVPISGTVGIS
ncbi:hypothetical protein CRM22_009646 [Opisthorchis felineus]|uniref:Transcription factor CBF/NF-Y/archaeal histone domain-containing protein n=1 Tax=Opisthorchis felineus TaxID=147828 RepID=A0A4S2LDT0_OPIFE|nr:hypothetical protein CRM22_009646 [Opisthorchis felineus]